MARRAHIILGGAPEETPKMLPRPKNVITIATDWAFSLSLSVPSEEKRLSVSRYKINLELPTYPNKHAHSECERYVQTKMLIGKTNKQNRRATCETPHHLLADKYISQHKHEEITELCLINETNIAHVYIQRQSETRQSETKKNNPISSKTPLNKVNNTNLNHHSILCQKLQDLISVIFSDRSYLTTQKILKKCDELC